jgi:hypothetical protein
MLAGLNIRNKQNNTSSSTSTEGITAAVPTTDVERKFQDDLAKAMAESMKESPFQDASGAGLDLSAMESLPKTSPAETKEELVSPETSASSITSMADTSINSNSSSSNNRRPSYTAAARRTSRANTLDSAAAAAAEKSATEQLSDEVEAFAHTVGRFKSQVVNFSQRKVALSEQKAALEANATLLSKELTTAEAEQNHAIENEDYEAAETFNATILGAQNRQSRNASELR